MAVFKPFPKEMQGKLYYNLLTKAQEKVATRQKQHKFRVCPETGIHLAGDTGTNDIRMEVAGIEGFGCCKAARQHAWILGLGTSFSTVKTKAQESKKELQTPGDQLEIFDFISIKLGFFWCLGFEIWSFSGL